MPLPAQDRYNPDSLASPVQKLRVHACRPHSRPGSEPLLRVTAPCHPVSLRQTDAILPCKRHSHAVSAAHGLQRTWHKHRQALCWQLCIVYTWMTSWAIYLHGADVKAGSEARIQRRGRGCSSGRPPCQGHAGRQRQERAQLRPLGEARQQRMRPGAAMRAAGPGAATDAPSRGA